MRSDQGVVIEVGDGLEALGKADIIIIPAWSDPEVAAPAELSNALRKAHKKGKLVVGLCLGAFALGDAGLLDGKEATTHRSEERRVGKEWVSTCRSRRWPKH